MLCKELQISDWVTSDKGIPMQITNIGEDYAYATWEGDEGDMWEFDDKTEPPYPIPLTEEIFKKNGFTWEVWGDNNIYAALLIQEKNIFIKWRMQSSNLAIWFSYNEYKDNVFANIIIPVKFVHELQQVLRLTGLGDMANNFKI